MALTYKSNLTKRTIASFLDYLLIFLGTWQYISYFGHPTAEGRQEVTGLMTLPILLAWFIYFVVVEAIWGGTLTHQLLNLKVLTIDRKKIPLKAAIKRHLIDPIDIFFWGIPGIITIKNTDKHQRIGDLWAKTIVVDMKDPEQNPAQNPPT